jgi:hypothetical protein
MSKEKLVRANFMISKVLLHKFQMQLSKRHRTMSETLRMLISKELIRLEDQKIVERI